MAYDTFTAGEAIDRRSALTLAAAGVAALGSGLVGARIARAEEAGEEETAPAEAPAADGAGEFITAGGYTLVPYQHFRTGGPDDVMHEVIMFENANSTFTKYQVGIVSCTCRDAALNYRSVMYVEMDNTAASPDKALLRWVTFGDDGGYTVGFWGDSSPIPTNEAYTKEYIDENLIQPMVGLTKADFDAWGGYGTLVGDIDVDAVAGATVTSSNVISALQGLFAYHAATYYKA